MKEAIDIMKDEAEKQLEGWDPEKAKNKKGLKAPIEFSTDAKPEHIKGLEIEEPKLKKIKRTKATVVDTKRNKKGLF